MVFMIYEINKTNEVNSYIMIWLIFGKHLKWLYPFIKTCYEYSTILNQLLY